jgi:hypothetical protein
LLLLGRKVLTGKKAKKSNPRDPPFNISDAPLFVYRRERERDKEVRSIQLCDAWADETNSFSIK